MKTSNPYPRQRGFRLRFHRAKQSLELFGQDYNLRPYSRAFESCFEMNDGNALVWVLMHEAIEGKNEYLAEGIRRTGVAVWPHWLELYEQRGKYATQQQQLSFFLTQPTHSKPKSPSVS